MAKIRRFNIILPSIYYIFGIFGFYFLFIMGITSGFLDLKKLFLILFVILPIIVLLLPIVIKTIMKIEFYKCILFSLIGVVIYFIIFSIVLLSIGTFSESNWKNDQYMNLRYLMIDDLESKYDLIGMNKDEIMKLLGETSGEGELCYPTSSFMITTYFYCLRYDENNLITEIYEKEVD